MKSKTGFFQRMLSFFIILGIIAGSGLVYMGYQKAEKAIDKNPINNLYLTYVGNTAIPDNFDASIFEEILNQIIKSDPKLSKIAAFFTDHTLAEIITERLYLPTDDTVSTTVGQRFVVHRLEKAYSQEELLLICYGLLGYDLTKGDIPDFSDSISVESENTIAKLSADAQAFLADIIAFLENQKLISPGVEQE